MPPSRKLSRNITELAAETRTATSPEEDVIVDCENVFGNLAEKRVPHAPRPLSQEETASFQAFFIRNFMRTANDCLLEALGIEVLPTSKMIHAQVFNNLSKIHSNSTENAITDIDYCTMLGQEIAQIYISELQKKTAKPLPGGSDPFGKIDYSKIKALPAKFPPNLKTETEQEDYRISIHRMINDRLLKSLGIKVPAIGETMHRQLYPQIAEADIKECAALAEEVANSYIFQTQVRLTAKPIAELPTQNEPEAQESETSPKNIPPQEPRRGRG